MDNNIFVELTNCDEETIRKISKYCEEYFREKSIKKQDEKYAENQKYVGKCYELKTKNGKRFYKVVSVKGNNQFRVSCLVFDEKPLVGFSPLISHHENEGRIDFDGIYVEDVMIDSSYTNVAIKNMEEISEGEWQYVLQRYVDQLIDFDWSIV